MKFPDICFVHISVVSREIDEATSFQRDAEDNSVSAENKSSGCGPITPNIPEHLWREQWDYVLLHVKEDQEDAEKLWREKLRDHNSVGYLCFGPDGDGCMVDRMRLPEIVKQIARSTYYLLYVTTTFLSNRDMELGVYEAIYTAVYLAPKPTL